MTASKWQCEGRIASDRAFSEPKTRADAAAASQFLLNEWGQDLGSGIDWLVGLAVLERAGAQRRKMQSATASAETQ